MRQILARGMLSGLAAGVAAFGFALAFGEPSVRRAIEIEDRRNATLGLIAEPEVVSRGVQATLGLGATTCVLGVALGGIVAILFALVQDRWSTLRPRGTAAVVSLCGFVAAVLVPFLKYPPNPPAVGQPDTVGRRTGLYLVMLVVSVALAVAMAALRQQIQPRRGAWVAGITAVVGYVVLVAIAQRALPSINEAAPDFPADVLWEFRVSALGTQAVLWTSIGLVFGALLARSSPTRDGAPVSARS